MGQLPPSSLTDREAQIMDRLWEFGTATAEQIRLELPDAPHDSTVRTLLRILEEKGFVGHQRQGRSFIYHAIVQREKVQRRTLGNIIRHFFSGSPQDLVLRLLEDEQLSAADLQELMEQATERPGSKSRRPPQNQSSTR
jgi:BlaI family transcriptional regulator, penicillinase repressor